MSSYLRRLWADESGQAMVEYGVIIAVIAVAAVALLAVFWGQMETLFNGIATDLQTAPDAALGDS